MNTNLKRLAITRLPTRWGIFEAAVFLNENTGIEHIALYVGAIKGKCPLVRIHSECLTGDAFASLRCDCGEQLDLAMNRISQSRLGVLIYMRGHEGRGIGLSNKIKAYSLQDSGLDTVDANSKLGFSVDDRCYEDAGHMLNELGVTSIRLMTNNPEKVSAMEGMNIQVVERLPHVVTSCKENYSYLETKRLRLGHLLND